MRNAKKFDHLLYRVDGVEEAREELLRKIECLGKIGTAECDGPMVKSLEVIVWGSSNGAGFACVPFPASCVAFCSQNPTPPAQLPL